ncbi:hypothetical protein JTE90_023827 [Oedothorax gibbosus]|uniref:Uncharacterized protein n=1 Tax=Oedothorax gibbosus TaxID=931172 RepID=A0AAV6VHN4_9ARAC|nr:hypothetical protein JTE90_023827 [Oedothorax gibbosus]
MNMTKYRETLSFECIHPTPSFTIFFSRRVSLALVPKATNDGSDDSDEEPGTASTAVSVVMIDDEMKIATRTQMEPVRLFVSQQSALPLLEIYCLLLFG